MRELLRGLRMVFSTSSRCLWKALVLSKESQVHKSSRYTRLMGALITCPQLILGNLVLQWLFFFVKIICSNDVSGCIPSLHSPNLNFCWWGKYTWDSNLTNWFLQFQSIGLTGVSFKTTFGREVATCHSWSQWRVWIRLSCGAIAEVIVDNVCHRPWLEKNSVALRCWVETC
jgi:hypothetical protein